MKEIRVMIDGQTEEYTVAESKARKVNRWRGWICSVGVDGLYIDFDGGVWRGPCRVGGSLGTIHTAWAPQMGMVTCTRYTCDCGTGIKMFKCKANNPIANIVAPIQEQVIPIQWDLGRKCNFNCSYCWPTSHNKIDKWLPIQKLLEVVDKICDSFEGQLQFNFAGGEPTLHPDFLTLCMHIWEKGHRIHVQTNGSMSERKAKELAAIAEISISVHFEFIKIAKLAKNIRAVLSGPNNGLEVKMMVAPSRESFGRMWELLRYLETTSNIKQARVIVSPLRDPVTNDLMGYTDVELSQFGDVEYD
jgi:organic radical activating enzyme